MGGTKLSDQTWCHDSHLIASLIIGILLICYLIYILFFFLRVDLNLVQIPFATNWLNPRDYAPLIASKKLFYFAVLSIVWNNNWTIANCNWSSWGEIKTTPAPGACNLCDPSKLCSMLFFMSVLFYVSVPVLYLQKAIVRQPILQFHQQLSDYTS
jgi:hypothetical protein